jgi:hypothetical protein
MKVSSGKILLALLLIATLYWVFFFRERDTLEKAIKRVEMYYAKDIERICNERNLPPEYFKALIILECGARKPAPSRFEPLTFKQMSAVKSGKADKFFIYTSQDLQKYTYQNLRDMSTSWGALQIMGYHAPYLNISLDKIQSSKTSLYYGILWVDKSYGQLLREGNFKDAFHLHNTGKKHPIGAPTTTDPLYVAKGLEYIKIFATKQKAAAEQQSLIK